MAEPVYSNPGYEDVDPDFCTEEEIVAMLPKVYKLILEVLDSYMVLAPDTRKIVAAWVLSAPYYRFFDAFPYLFINASKGSGKTRLLSLICAMLPDSILAASLSESALFRSRQKKLLIAIDEAEHMHGKEKENLRELLNSGYKNGGVVLRTGKDKTGNYHVEEYPVYGPIAMANIWGMDSVLESRCLTVVLQKSDDQQVTHTPLMLGYDPRIKAIRHFAEGDGEGEGVSSVSRKKGRNKRNQKDDTDGGNEKKVQVGVGNVGFVPGGVGEWVGRYMDANLISAIRCYFLNIIYINKPTLPTLTYTNQIQKDFISLVQVVQTNGRDFELWLPLLVTTYTASPSIALELKGIIEVRAKERSEEEAEEDRDANYALELFEYLHTLERGAWISLKDFITFLGPDYVGKVNPEFLSRLIKRLGVKKAQKRTNRGNEYQIDPVALRHYLRVRGILNTAADQGEGVQSPSLPGPQKGQSPLTSTRASQTPREAPAAHIEAASPPPVNESPPTPNPPPAQDNAPTLKSAQNTPSAPERQASIEECRAFIAQWPKEGLILGQRFENAPPSFLRCVMDARAAGEIREIRPGVWARVEP